MSQASRSKEGAGKPLLRYLDDLGQDVRFAVRGLRRSPGFAALAILVLALAIAANTAIFALVDVLMLRPLGMSEPDRLVRVFNKNTAEADTFRSFSYPNYLDLRDGAPGAFEDLGAFTVTLVGLDSGDGTTRREFAQIVTSSYFSTLGAVPALGRTFTAEEEKPNAGIRSVIVSHSFWARAGADPEQIGKPLEINGEQYTVVGVTPDGFGGVSALLTTDLWLPLGVFGTSVGEFMAGAGGDLSARDRHELMVIGRLSSDLWADEVLPELQAAAARLAAEYPDVNRDYTVVLAPQPRFSLSSRPSSDTAFTAASAVMLAMAGIVLLVACLNLANMFLARGAARRAEIAIRQSLGGGRARILRQLLTEGFLVSVAGGAVGLLLGVLAARWVVASIVPAVPFGTLALDVGVGTPVLIAALGYCTLATLFFALGPSLELVRSAVVEDLKDASARQSAGGPRRGRRLMPKNALVVAQIALSLALITAAGLFVQSAQRASSYVPEFAVDGRVLVELDASLASFDEPRATDLYRRVLERMRGEPGVIAAALASNVPFSSISEGDAVRLSGAAEESAVDAEHYVVTSDYFETMGLALLRGRDFSVAEAGEIGDPGTGGAVAIVDEPLARKLRPDGDVLGQMLVVSTPREEVKERTVEIVGVVPGVRRALFDRVERTTLYLPFGGNYRSHMIVHLQVGAGDGGRRLDEDAAAAVFATASREIRAIDPRLPILSMKTLSGHLEQGLERWMVRTGASVFTALGGVAVLLALVGVYGVKSYLVSRRTREIGIRMALGATPRNVLSWMLYDGLPSTVVGLVAGTLLALGIGRLLSSALYGIGGGDLVTFIAAPVLLAAAALLAAYLPSRRATRLAPAEALREE